MDTEQSLDREGREMQKLLWNAGSRFMFGEDESISGTIYAKEDIQSRLNASWDNWFTISATHNAFVSMPWTIILNCLLQIFSDFCDKASQPNSNFTVVERNFRLFDYEFTQNFGLLLFDTIAEATDESEIDAVLSQFYSSQIIGSALIVLVGLVIGSLAGANLAKIRTSFRFILAAAAMVPPRYVMQDSNLLALFSGQMETTQKEKDAQTPCFEKAKDEIQEAVFILDANETVLSFNKYASSMFRLAEQVVKNVPIDKIIEFDVELGEAPTVAHATNVNFGIVFRVEVMLFKGIGQEKESVLIIRDLTQLHKEKKKIRKLEGEIERMRKAALPPKIHQKHFDAHKCVVCVVHMANFDRLAQQHSVNELHDIVANFVLCVDQEIASTQSALKLHQLGMAIYVIFNLAGHGLQPLGLSTALASAFCKRVAASLQGQGISVGFGVARDETAKAGMVSMDRLLFDFYGNSMRLAYALARKAEEGTAMFAANVPEFEEVAGIRFVRATIETLDQQNYPSLNLL
jgi:hypothetical protein